MLRLNTVYFHAENQLSGGYVSAVVVLPDPANTEAIRIWPLPLCTRTDVRKFLDLVSYYRNLIPALARTVASVANVVKREERSTGSKW